MKKLRASLYSHVLVWLLIVLYLGLVFYVVFHSYPADYLMLLTGGKLLVQGRLADLYSINAQQNVQLQLYETYNILGKGTLAILPFRYLPMNTFIFYPFTFFAFRHSLAIYFLWNSLLIFLSVVTLFGVHNVKSKIRFDIVLLLVFTFYFTVLTFMNGHPMYLLLLVALIYAHFVNNNNLSLGFFSALLLFKLHYLFFVPFLFILSKDRYKFILGFIPTFLLLWVFNIYLYGIGLPFDYLAFVLKTESSAFGSYIEYMNSFAPFLQHVFKLTKNSAYLVNFVLYMLVLIALYIKNTGKSAKEDLFIGSLILSFYLALHAYPAELVLLIIPLVIGLIKPNPHRALGVAITYLLFILSLHSSAALGLGILFLGLYYLFSQEVSELIDPLYLKIRTKVLTK